MESHIEVMYDDRYHDARSKFEILIYQIQSSYQVWFDNRINVVTNDFPDKIYNYYCYYYNDKHEIALSIKEELPKVISRECSQAFDSIFLSSVVINAQ